MLTLSFGLSVIPVENPAPSSPVLGPTIVESWTVPSNPFKLAIVSMVSAQYPIAISVNSTITIVLEWKPFRNRFASSV